MTNAKRPDGGFFDPDHYLLDEHADEVMLSLLARDNEPAPVRVRRRMPVPSPAVTAHGDFVFNRAEFLRHMQGLIVRREEEARDWRKLERVALDATPPRKPYVPSPDPRLAPPRGLSVEPWFRPDWTPTRNGMLEIEKYALGYLAAAMRVSNPGRVSVTPTITLACRRDADAIAGALYPLAAAYRGQYLVGMCVTVIARELVEIGIEFRA